MDAQAASVTGARADEGNTHATAPAEIRKMRTLAIGDKVEGVTGGLEAK